MANLVFISPSRGGHFMNYTCFVVQIPEVSVHILEAEISNGRRATRRSARADMMRKKAAPTPYREAVPRRVTRSGSKMMKAAVGMEAGGKTPAAADVGASNVSTD